MNNRNQLFKKRALKRSATALAGPGHFAFDRLEFRQLLAIDCSAVVLGQFTCDPVGNSNTNCNYVGQVECHLSQASQDKGAYSDQNPDSGHGHDCKHKADSDMPYLDTLSLLSYVGSTNNNTSFDLQGRAVAYNDPGGQGTNSAPPVTNAGQAGAINPPQGNTLPNNPPSEKDNLFSGSSSTASAYDAGEMRTSLPAEHFLQPVSLMASSETDSAIPGGSRDLKVGRDSWFSKLQSVEESKMAAAPVRSGLIDHHQTFSLVSSETSIAGQASESSNNAEQSATTLEHAARDAMIADYRADGIEKDTGGLWEADPDADSTFLSEHEGVIIASGFNPFEVLADARVGNRWPWPDGLPIELPVSNGGLRMPLIPSSLVDDVHSIHAIESAIFFAVLASSYPRRKLDEEAAIPWRGLKQQTFHRSSIVDHESWLNRWFTASIAWIQGFAPVQRQFRRGSNFA